MSVTAVITFYPLPEHRAEIVASFEEAISTFHASEAGCELCALQEGDDRLVMIEKWASPEQVAAHGQSPVLATLMEGLAGKLSAAPDVQILRPHPAGTAQQGSL
jgi:quinol monooxygenase YgiN